MGPDPWIDPDRTKEITLWFVRKKGTHGRGLPIRAVKKLGRALDVWVPTLSGEPTPQRPRLLTPAQTTILDEQVHKWLSLGVIEEMPHSAFFNNLVFVAKKNGSIRVCDDCTPANDVTEDFDWPLPALQDVRHRLQGSKWFAKIDLRDAFFRISIPTKYRYLTAFRSKGTQYRFRKMPFGLKTAPAFFQRYMDHSLATLGEGYINYIDDVLIHAETRTELRRRVHALKNRIRTMGCEVNEDKSEYDKRALLFVGLWIFSTGIGPNKIKADLASKLPAPQTKKDAQSALGLVSHLRDFLPLISHFTSLLYPNREGFLLSPSDYEREWQRLTRHIGQAISTLRHMKAGVPVQLYTDASGAGIGVILIQEGRIVAIASRQMTGAEQRYSATDREHIALVYAAKKFPLFLHQSNGDTSVWSDHAALINRKDKDLLPKQARWKQIVQHWMPNLKHVKGLDNPADYVSRWQLGNFGGVLKT